MFLDRQFALMRHSVGHRRAHSALELVRPGLERGAVQKDRSRNIEVVAQRMELMKFVDTISDGIGERIFLSIKSAGLDHE